MKHVLIPTKLAPIAGSMLEGKGYSVVVDSETSLSELVSRHPETEVMIVRSEKVTPEIIDALPNLKLVVRAGAGYNTIDTKYARRRGVDVMNTPGANANAVAEEVFALALSAYRFVVPADNSTRAGLWEKKKFLGRELTGRTLGIVGLGNIGQLVARRSAGFEMKLLGYDPILSAERAAEVGVKLVSMEELFAQSDIVTLHVPENDQTRGMVNASLLGKMKDGAMIVNCARAGIINEDDLRAARAEKGLVFCNDVYAADVAGDKSVADMADVMLPHLGANTSEANTNAARRAAEQILEYDQQGISRFVVNKGVPDGFDVAYQRLAHYVVRVARNCLGGKETAISQIKCSFYGELKQFSRWFLSPICAALSADFDMTQDPEEAEEMLEERGIDFENRELDADKLYGNSITIDLVGGNGKDSKTVSVRGTIAENNLIISRIDEFDQLYFTPCETSFVAVYEDRPGVLAEITSACADAGVNIDKMRVQREKTERFAICILRADKSLSDAVVNRIRERIAPTVAFSL